jgi:hypothetical protein
MRQLPASDPRDAPLVRVEFNKDWLPIVLGLLAALENPYLYADTEAAALEELMAVEVLISLFGEAVDV